MGMSAEAAGWVLPKVVLLCTHLAPGWAVLSILVWALLLGLLAVCCHYGCCCPRLHSFRVCYLVSMLSAWATSYLLSLLLCLPVPTLLQDIFCLGVATYAGAADWVLPVLLLHHARFAPGYIACPGVLLGQCCCCSCPMLI